MTTAASENGLRGRAPWLAPALALLVLAWLAGTAGICRAQPKIVTSASSASQIRGVDFTPRSIGVPSSRASRPAPAETRRARYPRLITEQNILNMINEYSRLHGVDPKLVYALIEQESRFNRFAVSPRGAQGLMQIMPDTQKLLGLTDPFDERKNIDAGVRYLKAMLERFETETLALAAYNAGPGAVDKYNGVPPYEETKDYVLRVVDRYFFLRMRFADNDIGQIHAKAGAAAADN